EEAGVGNGERIVYYECTAVETDAGGNPGKTSGTDPAFWELGCQTPDRAKVWSPNWKVMAGTSARRPAAAPAGGRVRPIAPGRGADQFARTTTRPDPPGEPVWNYAAGTTTADLTSDDNEQTPDAYPVWLTLHPDACRTCVIRDGKAVFACRT